MKKGFLAFLICFCWSILVLAQTHASNSSGGTKKVQIDQAATLEGVTINGESVTKLSGGVRFSQGNVWMTCDSAFLFEKENKLKAFGNVFFQTLDGSTLQGDYLEYEGNVRKARLEKNIVMKDKSMVLVSQLVYYDLNTEQAYYPNWATINDAENRLTSHRGYYYSKIDEFFFKDSVVLVNPRYTMYSDTLRYQTLTKKAYFLGKTIIRSKENTIYCQNGWYNTQEEKASFNKRVNLISASRDLKADSITYFKKEGLAQAYGNICLYDSAQKIMALGQRGNYYELSSKAWITQKAYAKYLFKDDTLWIASDSIFYKGDTLKKEMRVEARTGVKFYKSNLSGFCDTLIYDKADSLLRFIGKPLVWADSVQLKANQIQILISNNKPDSLFLNQKAFIASHAFEKWYNQLKGRSMKGKFVDNKLHYLESTGNAQAIYFIQNNEKAWEGGNKSFSSKMSLILKENEIEQIQLFGKPDGKFIPVQLFTEEELILPDFKWEYQSKPKGKADIIPASN